MSKVILEFNLPEEREAFDNALNGEKYHSALFEMGQNLRRYAKYDTETKPPDTWEGLQQMFWNFLKENDVEL